MLEHQGLHNEFSGVIVRIGGFKSNPVVFHLLEGIFLGGGTRAGHTALKTAGLIGSKKSKNKVCTPKFAAVSSCL